MGFPDPGYALDGLLQGTSRHFRPYFFVFPTGQEHKEVSRTGDQVLPAIGVNIAVFFTNCRNSGTTLFVTGFLTIARNDKRRGRALICTHLLRFANSGGGSPVKGLNLLMVRAPILDKRITDLSP